MGPDDKPPRELLSYPAIANTDSSSTRSNSTSSSTSSSGNNPCIGESDSSCTTKTDADGPYRSIQIPLSSDSEFFRLLNAGLSNLEDLQAHEKKDLDSQVALLRESIVEVTSPTTKKADQAAIYAWREVFRIYMEMQIFFSTGEADCGERSSEVARQRLETFQTQLVKEQHAKKLGRNGRRTLEMFMHINLTVLQNLKFQEINGMALSKILKKFDKQTALHARSAFTRTGPFSVSSLSRSVCQAISEQILVVVPQLDDYLCPVCFNISFKPVRLKCSHVFCIRCLVIMQRAQRDHCPMCRAEVVMEATSSRSSPLPLYILSIYTAVLKYRVALTTSCRKPGSKAVDLLAVILPQGNQGQAEGERASRDGRHLWRTYRGVQYDVTRRNSSPSPVSICHVPPDDSQALVCPAGGTISDLFMLMECRVHVLGTSACPQHFTSIYVCSR